METQCEWAQDWGPVGLAQKIAATASFLSLLKAPGTESRLPPGHGAPAPLPPPAQPQSPRHRAPQQR